MTSTIDEELLRRALHEAVHDVDASDGAQQRILDAALARHVDADADDDEEMLEQVPESPAHRSSPRRMPLAAAAAVLLVTAVVLSLTTFGHGSQGPRSASPLSLHQASGTKSLGNPGYATFAGGQSAANTSLGTWASTNVAGNGTGLRAANGVAPTSAPAGTLAPKVVAVGAVAMKVPSTRLQTVLGQLTVLVTRDGGYVASSKVVAGSSGETSTATIVLRVPEHRFDSLVAVTQHYGTPTSVVTNSSDVTSQFVDYQARIRALEASRTQYLAILAKAGSIGSILAVQAQIDNLQTQIDQLEGQRNVLVNEAAYSMLTVTLNPGQGPSSANPSGLATAWSDSIGGFVKGFESVVRAAGPALFAVLCLLVLFLLGRLGWRATRRRML
jgi:hypothetical protein